MGNTRRLLRKYHEALGDPSIVDLVALLFIGWLIWPLPIAVALLLAAVHLAALFLDAIVGAWLVLVSLPTVAGSLWQLVMRSRWRAHPALAPVRPSISISPPTKRERIEALNRARRTEAELIESSGLPAEDCRALQNEADDRLRDRLREVLR